MEGEEGISDLRRRAYYLIFNITLIDFNYSLKYIPVILFAISISQASSLFNSHIKATSYSKPLFTSVSS